VISSFGETRDDVELIGAENTSLTGMNNKYAYVKPEMKYKQGGLLIAADAACQKSARMSQHNICCSSCCAACVFCAGLMLPKEKGKGVTADIWWVQEQLIDYRF